MTPVGAPQVDESLEEVVALAAGAVVTSATIPDAVSNTTAMIDHTQVSRKRSRRRTIEIHTLRTP
jgi:hypothetical protein